ncbi:MAG: hypothetical protein VB778_00620, partial [Nitrospinaceae bacterium]
NRVVSIRLSAPLYREGQDRPAKPTRWFVGLHYLKHAKDLSDEEVVAKIHCRQSRQEKEVTRFEEMVKAKGRD